MRALKRILTWFLHRLLDVLSTIPVLHDRKLDTSDRIVAIVAHVWVTILVILLWIAIVMSMK